MLSTDDRETLFRVVLTPEQLDRAGCNHNWQYPHKMQGWSPDCRACSISLQMHQAVDAGHLEMRTSRGYDENGRLFQVIEGRTWTEAGRRVLCRLQAAAMGHREPLVPESAHG